MILDIALGILLAMLMLSLIGPLLWVAGVLIVIGILCAAGYALWHYFPDEITVGAAIFALVLVFYYGEMIIDSLILIFRRKQ